MVTANRNEFGFLSPPKAPDELGRLGTYRVLKVIGQGGMGVVFLAEDPQLERTVALKAMLPEAAKKGTAKERFLREARATAKIEHDHIVTIYQVGEDRGVPFLAMQLLKGTSLEDFLVKKQGSKTGTPLAVDQILKLGREIAKGLSAAHEHGLIHRDIKPANIWLDATAGGRVKILDFGLARVTDGESNLTKIGSIVGTATYMAPEQACGGKLDGRADLFSLGCILYRLCTGRVPWRGGDISETLIAVNTEEATPVQELNPDLPPQFAKLVMSLLAKKADNRPASAKAVVEAIQAIERDLPTAQMKALIPVAVAVPGPTALASQDRTQASGVLARPKGLSQEMSQPKRPVVRRTTNRRPGRRRPWLLVGALAGVAGLALIGAIVFLASSGNEQSVAKASSPVARSTSSPATTARPSSPAVRQPTTPKPPEPQPKPPEPQPKPPEPEPQPKPPEPKPPEPEPQPKPPEPRPDGPNQVVNSINMKLNLVPAGTFQMGASAADIDRVRKAPLKGYMFPGWEKECSPQHEVRLTKSYYMSIFAVTQGQYDRVMGRNPSFNKESPDHPVETVNWHEAMEFCKRLSELPPEKMAGRVYRLPTEAEWEHACRAETTTLFHYGQSLSTKQANFNGQVPLGTDAQKEPSIGKTVKVGSYKPNALGLYDMHGNVWSWCLDGQRVYTPKAVTDPRGPETADAPRAMRGGGWREGPVLASYRKFREPTNYRGNYLGFRVICERP